MTTSWDDGDKQRRQVHKALQEAGPSEYPSDGGDPAAAILTGWVVVQEWMDKDGPFLSRGWDENSPMWKAKGLLHEALYGDWDEPED